MTPAYAEPIFSIGMEGHAMDELLALIALVVIGLEMAVLWID